MLNLIPYALIYIVVVYPIIEFIVYQRGVFAKNYKNFRNEYEKSIDDPQISGYEYRRIRILQFGYSSLSNKELQAYKHLLELNLDLLNRRTVFGLINIGASPPEFILRFSPPVFLWFALKNISSIHFPNSINTFVIEVVLNLVIPVLFLLFIMLSVSNFITSIKYYNYKMHFDIISKELENRTKFHRQ